MEHDLNRELKLTMSSSVQNIKEQLHQLADQLPANATWKDVEDQMRFRRAVQEGLDQADRGQFASAEEIRTVFARYGVNYDA